MSEKLKPCPFCGSEAVHTESSYFRDVLIYCENCDAYFTVDSFAADKDDVVEAWNRRAEPERKKGKWVKVVSEYFTPGGDPVWKCSECGKGMHVYGVEYNTYNRGYTDGHQWIACPNCGADMRGEE